MAERPLMNFPKVKSGNGTRGDESNGNLDNLNGLSITIKIGRGKGMNSNGKGPSSTFL